MSGQADIDVEEGVLQGNSFGVRKVRVAYMNVGQSCDATHKFLESGA